MHLNTMPAPDAEPANRTEPLARLYLRCNLSERARIIKEMSLPSLRVVAFFMGLIFKCGPRRAVRLRAPRPTTRFLSDSSSEPGSLKTRAASLKNSSPRAELSRHRIHDH